MNGHTLPGIKQDLTKKPAKKNKRNIGEELKKKYKSKPQTTDVEGRKIPYIHKGHDDEELRGDLVEGTSPRHKYHLKENITQAERAKLMEDPDYKNQVKKGRGRN